jgi:hypothetical protein
VRRSGWGLSIGIGEIFNDIAPVLTAQLQRAGFDATLRMTADVGTRMSQAVRLPT